tara:strand:+ start:1902 stop:2759 length:858 start_codon:yes stop_codon:yes gene_type:complete
MIKLKKLLEEIRLNERAETASNFKTKAALDKLVKQGWEDFAEYTIPNTFGYTLSRFRNPNMTAMETWKERGEDLMHPAFMAWLRDNLSFVGTPPAGKELYALYQKLIDLIKKKPDAILDDYDSKNADPEFSDIKNKIMRLVYDIGGPRADYFENQSGSPKHYDALKAHFKKAGGGGEPMYLGFNHIKGGYAELPEELLNALPNKAQITQQMDKINSGDTDLEPGDPMLYKYDQLLTKGLIDLMKKNGAKITKKDIEMEDDSVSISASVKPASVSALEKLGFEKNE